MYFVPYDMNAKNSNFCLAYCSTFYSLQNALNIDLLIIIRC